MLDLRRLRLLVELPRRGTIGAVATALSYSPSSVSSQLGVLEREAGVALLESVGRRVRLTAAGELLVTHASRCCFGSGASSLSSTGASRRLRRYRSRFSRVASAVQVSIALCGVGTPVSWGQGSPPGRGIGCQA